MEATMTRRAWLVAAILSLSACGGGGYGTPDLTAVVEVAYGETGDASGLTYHSDGPVRIVLADWLETFPNHDYLQHTLRHELFHAVTTIRDHTSDVSCVSATLRSPYDPMLAMPCAWEREEMRASEPIRVRFRGHTDEAWAAASWWNYACGKVVIEVVED